MTTKIYSGKTEDVIAQYNEEQPLIEQNIQQQQNIAALTSDAVMSYSEVLKDIGRIESTNFYATISDVVCAKTFLKIKNEKKYKGLPYRDENGNTRQIADLDEFCRVFLKKSARRVQELAQNLHLLGPELYEQAESIGFRTKDYQALRALPSDEQEIVKQAIESQDKETAIELMQEMAVKYSKEKEELKKQVDDTQADYKALQKRNTDISKEKEEMGLKLSKYELKTIPMDERIAPFKEQVAQTQSQVDSLFNEHRQYIELMDKLQFEAMDNDPNYEAGETFELPESLQMALLALNGALLLTLAQARQMHQELWSKFADEIETASAQFDMAINETRNAID